MKTFLGTSLYTAGLSFVISACTLSWMMDDSPIEGSLSPVSITDGIKNIDVKFKNNTVQLNVHIDRPMSCNQVFRQLNLKSIQVESKVLVPECSEMTPNLIIVTYREYITT